MDRKVIIVTGANCGLGLDTAKGLCELGHDVVVSVRDDAKGEATIADITAAVPEASVMYITMEMSDPQSIRNFVAKFRATEKILDVLINNAGLFKEYESPKRACAREDSSLEITMTVNCMGSFLLTQLLLDELNMAGTECNPSRVVNVSSSLTVVLEGDAHRAYYMDDLMLTEAGHYVSGVQAYRNSKLALNTWTKVLAERLRGSNVIANAVCPGFIIKTGLARENVATWKGYLFLKFMDSFIGRALGSYAEPLSAGTRRLIEMAVDQKKTTNGLYYCDGEASDEAEEVLNAENKEKIWALCVKYSGLEPQEEFSI